MSKDFSVVTATGSTHRVVLTRECEKARRKINIDSAAKPKDSDAALDDTLEHATAVHVHEKPNVPTAPKPVSFGPSPTLTSSHIRTRLDPLTLR